MLADRICIMANGQITILDSPDNIKKEFGVGYKLIFESKAGSSLRIQEIERKLKRHIVVKENHDSTKTKLQFIIPFEKVSKIQDILVDLQSDEYSMDVVINSLEDAYINITKSDESSI